MAEYVEAKLREGQDFEKRKKPWLLKQLSYLAGNGPCPGPPPE